MVLLGRWGTGLGLGLGFLRALLEFSRGGVVGGGLRCERGGWSLMVGGDEFSPDKYSVIYCNQSTCCVYVIDQEHSEACGVNYTFMLKAVHGFTGNNATGLLVGWW